MNVQVRTWPVMLAAAAILLITMGSRQSLGLFVSPIRDATGVGLVSIAFAMAVGQFVWGAVQPVFGMVADRYGAARVLVLGAVLLAAGTLLTTVASNEWMLVVAIGVLTAAGAGAGSFSVLIGATQQQLPPEKRAFASGFINAGGSAGQFVFAPLNQLLISAFGWAAAMYAMAAAALATLPLVRPLVKGSPQTTVHGPQTEKSPGAAAAAAATAAASAAAPVAGAPVAAAPVAAAVGAAPATLSLREQLRAASRDRSYWCLHLGFFTCGFHIAFLVTHLPGEVELCSLPASVAAGSLAIIGLANIAGSLTAGSLGNVMRMKWLLFWMYFGRAAAIAVYLAMPKTAATFYVFAAVLGFTWLATVPPTAGLVGKLFGVRYLATLFGLTLLSHQIGGFFGAWLGGVTRAQFGDFGWMWYADMALAFAAALINLPIREAPVRRGLALQGA